MSDFTPQDLDDKIHNFITKKLDKFPELQTMEPIEHESREGISRQFFPSSLRFGAQY